MPRSIFESLDSFIRRFHRVIIVVWLIIILASVMLTPRFFASVSYNISDSSFLAPPDTESQRAQRILDEQFPTLINQSGNNIIMVIKSKEVYSDDIRRSLLTLEKTLIADSSVKNFSGITSIYSMESDIINSFASKPRMQLQDLSTKIALMNQGLYSLQENLTSIHKGLFEAKKGVSETAQLVYGVPMMYTATWMNLSFQGRLDPYTATNEANKIVLQQTSNFNENPLTLGYYSTFVRMWNASLSNPSITTPINRVQFAVDSSVTTFMQNPAINASTKRIFFFVASGLNATSWVDDRAVTSLTVTVVASQIPDAAAKNLGVSPQELTLKLYSLGPTPSPTAVSNFTVELFTKILTRQDAVFTDMITRTGFSAEDFVKAVYGLGRSPTGSAVWGTASLLLTRATAASLQDSPLITVSEPALYRLLTSLNTTQSTEEVVSDLLVNRPIDEYPLILSSTTLRSFVSPRNDTMIVILNFSASEDIEAISAVKKDIEDSSLSRNAKVYATGHTLFAQEMSGIFESAHGLTVIVGVAFSIVIAALLFRSPVAAALPLLISGLSIVISYSAIYVVVIVISGGTISFLTPTLTTLLMLGLGVDYSVILLRRTREERLAGKGREESVGVSTRWAGQAIITAGIAVIVSYIVMAIAGVPMFSSVAVSIALGVSILLVLAITLIPSLELLLGDRIFWPRLNRGGGRRDTESLLLRISEATLRRKIPIVVVFTLLAVGAFYVSQVTPTGMDIPKLIPNFPSNQAITEIAENIGGSSVAPTYVVASMSTPVTYGHNQFNETMLDVIEEMTTALKNLKEVSGVTSATQPFGRPFNYHAVENISEPTRSQYLAGMMRTIGKDNKTLLITLGFTHPPFTPESISSLLEMQSKTGELASRYNIKVHYGGITQSIYDSQSFIASIFPQVVAILVTAIYIILFIQLMSAFTPLRLIFTILTSVATALTFIYLVFYYTLNLPIMNFVPLFVVVTMLGVGIDYDIFLVTRIREEVLNGKSDEEAIKTAIAKTGVTIMGLGIILASVFSSLLLTGIPIFEEIGTAVAAAVLFDTFIVILIIVPALMGLAQRLNWWPSKPQRTGLAKDSNNLDA